MSQATFYVGDSLTVLRTLPDASVDLVLTSPPFLALRSYLPADHPDKALEMGSEPTPGAFIDSMLNIVEECRRVLAPHGSLCFEFGDTYSGSGGAGGDYNENGLRDGQAKFDGSNKRRGGNSRNDKQEMASLGIIGTTSGERAKANPDGWPLDKSLCLIPELFRFSLAYGFNPLTGRQTERWRVRNVVRWVRPNPPVGALADKFRPATSDLVVACTSRKRFFDLDAVRTEPTKETVDRGRRARLTPYAGNDRPKACDDGSNPAGAPPLDWWEIPPGGYPGSHYAVYPPELCVRPIKAMCPERVCVTCGKPSERITETVSPRLVDAEQGGKDRQQGRHVGGPFAKSHTVTPAVVETAGWTDCGHDNWRAGIVLDPFGGSGTTAVVATGHGRDAILIDLDERNADLARERVGMFLSVVDSRESVA